MTRRRQAQLLRTQGVGAPGDAPTGRVADAGAAADAVQAGRWVRVDLTVDDPKGVLDGPCGLSVWADRAVFWNDNPTLRRANPSLKGTTSVLRLRREQFRLRTVPAPQSVVTVLGRAYAINHAAFLPPGPDPGAQPPLADLNFLGQIAVDPLTTPAGAYVRGRILAGPLRLAEPALLLRRRDAAAFLERLWPSPNAAIRLAVVTAGALQMEVVEPGTGGGPVSRRVAYRGAWTDGTDHGRVWEGIACPDSPDVIDPAARLGAVIADITTLLTSLGVPVQLVPGGAPPGVFYNVVHPGGRNPPRPHVIELLRPGATLRFGGSPDGTVAEWTPGTLAVVPTLTPGDTDYVFTQVDTVGALIATGQPPDERIPTEFQSVIVEWVQPARTGDPAVFLSQSPQLYAAGASAAGAVGNDYLWQPVRPVPREAAADPSWSNLAPAWVRYRVADVPFLPGAIGLDRPRLPGWSGPLTVVDERLGSDLPSRWQVVLDMEDRATVPQRVTASISAGGVLLTLVAPQTVAISPAMPVFVPPQAQSLEDPGSVPPPLVYDGTLSLASIVFRHDGEDASAPLAQEALVVDPCPSAATSVPFELDAGRDAARMFPAALEALIDPSSATGGNLRALPGDQLVVHEGTTPSADPDPTKLRLADSALRLPDAYHRLTVRVGPAGGTIQTGTVTGPCDEGSGVWVVEVDPQAPFSPPPAAGWHYTLAVEQPHLPRDPNHGLVPLGLARFDWKPAQGSDGNPRLAALHFEETTLQGGALPSVLALAPWVEWGSSDPNWLVTSLARLHHRNLVLEHPEFAVALDDRTPDGPSSPTPAPVLPYRDVIQAVRDRYTEASGNLLSSQDADHKLQNWLPGADWVDDKNQPVAPRLDYQPATTSSAPAVTLSATGFATQVLSIDPAVGGTNFLEFDIGTAAIAVGTHPVLTLAPAQDGDGPARGRWRAVNSGAPLVFSPQGVVAAAALGPSAANPAPIILVGRADGTVILWSWSALTGRFEVADRFDAGNAAATGVALAAAAGTVTVAASYVDNAARLWTVPAPGISFVPGRFPRSAAPPAAATVFPHPAPVTSIALDGPWLLTGCADGKARLWNVGVDPPSVPQKVIDPAMATTPPIAVTAVAMARQGATPTLLVADAEGSLRRFSRDDASRNPPPLQTIPDPDGRSLPVELLAVEASTGRVLSGVSDQTLFLWTPRSDGTLDHTQPDVGLPAPLASVAWDETNLAAHIGGPAPGTRIVAGATDGLVRIRSVGGKADLATFACLGTEVSAVLTLSNGSQAGWLVAGTTIGTLHAWTLQDGRELAGAFADAAAAPAPFFDNLGVVRANQASNPGGPWIVELLAGIDGVPLRSVTYADDQARDAALFLVEPDGAGSPHYRSEVRLGCAALKLADADGTVIRPADGTDFEVERFPLGVYGLWSAAENLTSMPMAQANHWPRLGGAPVFPTRLKQLRLNPIPGGAGWEAAGITFEAALVNPLDLTADPPSDRVLPSVRDTVARSSVVTVAFTSGGGNTKVALVDGAPADFDWEFDVDAQPDPQTGFFPGKLARLAGTLAVTQGHVVLTVDPDRSAALVFGRLWKLALTGPLTLSVEAIVRNGRAVGVAYRKLDAPSGVDIEIVQDESTGPSLSFALPVALPGGGAIGADYALSATVATLDLNNTTVAALELGVRRNDWPAGVFQPAIARRTQDENFGFVLVPQPPATGVNPLTGVLVLWNEGDPTAPALGGVLISEQLAPGLPAQLATVGWSLKGDRLEMEVVASIVDGTGALTWEQRRLWSWDLEPDPAAPPPFALRLLLNEQIVDSGSNPIVTGFLDLPTTASYTPRLQGPVQLALERDDGSLLSLQTGLVHARAVDPPAAAPGLHVDVEFPLAGGVVRAFELTEVPEQASAPQGDRVAGFFELQATTSGIELYEVAEDDLALDLCLEPDAVNPIPLMPPSVPQLVHREVFGAQLRIALQALDSALQPVRLRQEFDPSPYSWLLSPVGRADRGAVLNAQRLWLMPSGGGTRRTEDVLVLFREIPGPGAGTARRTRAPDGPRPLPSVVSVLSGTGVDSNDPLFSTAQVSAAVLQAGAMGMVVRRTLRLGGPASYDFEQSPFADPGRAANPIYRGRAMTPPRPASPASAGPPTIDPRLITPSVIRLWTIPGGPGYALRPAPFDPYRPDPCAAMRVLELARIGPPVAAPVTPGRPTVLACRVAEVPAFRAAAALWYIPREMPELAPGRTQFLPRNVRVLYGPDKPGAMMEHLVTPFTEHRLIGGPAHWTLGPTTEVALREPQRIKVSDCVTAGVTVRDAQLITGPFPDDLWQLSVHWDELIGRVSIDASKLPESTDNLLVRSGQSFRFTSDPVVAVVQFEQDVFALRSDATVLQVYQVSPDGSHTAVRFPQFFLITRLSGLDQPISFTDSRGTLQFYPRVVVQKANADKPDLNAHLGDLFQEFLLAGDVGDGLLLWAYAPTTASAEQRPEHPNSDQFQLAWMATDSEGVVWTATFPSQALQLNRLNPSPLQPTLAAVGTRLLPGVRRAASGTPPLSRTLFFGDAAPADQAKPRFEHKNGTTYDFILEIRDLQETVQFGRQPDDDSAPFRLDLVKYLVPGQVVSGASTVKPPAHPLRKHAHELRGDR